MKHPTRRSLSSSPIQNLAALPTIQLPISPNEIGTRGHRHAGIALDGTIERVGNCPADLLELQGNVVVTAPPEVQDDTHRYEDGEFVLI